MRLQGKTIVLCVSGSVAAYKAVHLARLLVKEGASVRPILTESAKHFVGATTFSAITGAPVVDSMWAEPGEVHVSLAATADAVLVVPATADVLARMASGRASDLLSTLCLCARQPVFCAPAMHPSMWSHPAVQRNVRQLELDGIEFVGPVDGEVASGERGLGRMAEPEQVVEALSARLGRAPDLAGKQVVVTAGPTYEDIDPVRFLGNRSSGTLGFAIAEDCVRRGAKVTLIAGPVDLPTPAGVLRVDVRSATQMHDAVRRHSPNCDIFVMSAAVADFRPEVYSDSKIKKGAEVPLYKLVQNADILADVCAWPHGQRPQVVVGFALETGDDARVASLGAEKRLRKGCDLLIANRADQGLGPGDTRVCILSDAAAAWNGPAPKRAAATWIVAAAVAQLQALAR